MRECLQVGLVRFLDVRAGQKIDCHNGCASLSRTADAGRCDIMRVVAESLFGEYVIARLHKSGIIGINVAHIYPRPDAVCLQFKAQRTDDFQVFGEKQAGLGIGILSGSFFFRQAQAME